VDVLGTVITPVEALRLSPLLIDKTDPAVFKLKLVAVPPVPLLGEKVALLPATRLKALVPLT
jgi:hypothetical protein